MPGDHKASIGNYTPFWCAGALYGRLEETDEAFDAFLTSWQARIVRAESAKVQEIRAILGDRFDEMRRLAEEDPVAEEVTYWRQEPDRPAQAARFSHNK